MSASLVYLLLRQVLYMLTLRVPKTSSVLAMAADHRDDVSCGTELSGPDAVGIHAGPARGSPAVLPRLAYLGVTNTLALLRLLPMSDRAKDTEILALRHQITVLERHLHGERIRFTPSDRAWLAALLHPLPRHLLGEIRLLVRRETVLRWHRDLIARRHARNPRPKRARRPRTIQSRPSPNVSSACTRGDP
jgi:hypothetical protein